MIPKIIHFCWFGGNPLPPLALECIASWRKFLPEYRIIQWCETSPNPSQGGEKIADEVRFFDVNFIPYTAEAYRQKKYAYVSDYARFEIIYKYGGIYFDTDVEVIRPMDDIIARGNFMGFEQNPDGENSPGKYAPRYCFSVNPGLGFCMTPQHPFMREMTEHYKSLTFEPIPTGDIAWYKTIVAHTTEKLMEQEPPLAPPRSALDALTKRSDSKREGNSFWSLFLSKRYTEIQVVGDGIYVYPSEYFAPINAISRRLHITENTRTIHRYMASWSEKKGKTWMDYVKHYMPEFIFYAINKLKRERYKIK